MDLVKVQIIGLDPKIEDPIYQLVQQQTIILQTLTEKINKIEQVIYKINNDKSEPKTETETESETKVKLKVTVKPKTKETRSSFDSIVSPPIKPKLIISNQCLKPKLSLKIIDPSSSVPIIEKITSVPSYPLVASDLETGPLVSETGPLVSCSKTLTREQELELIVQERSEMIEKERQRKHIRERLQPRREKELPEEPVLDDQERAEKLKKISSKAPWANLAKKSKQMIHVEKQIYLDKMEEEQQTQTIDK